MIPRGHFTRIADEHAVDAKTVERDYVLAHTVAAISRHPTGLVFKGGTALRLCYFDDYRYSADLDFSLLPGHDLSAAQLAIQTALAETANQVGFPHLATSEDGSSIEYEGPLGRPRSLKLDLATDELVEDTTIKSLRARYPDQAACEVSVYTLEEIGAEKLRCVIQRLQARDFFDLNELFALNGLDLDEVRPTFERKCRHKLIDPALFGERFEMRIPHWRARWDDEMREHLGGTPDNFAQVERAVRRALRPMLRDP